MGIETVMFQKMLSVLLKDIALGRKIILPLKEFSRGSRESKKVRIMSLQPRFEQGKIFFADDLDKDFIETQILRFDPHKKSNKDDLLDTLADLEQIKIVPDGEVENKFAKYPLMRRLAWLQRTDRDEDEEYTDKDTTEVEYYAYQSSV
jgi:hypothetical protein